MNTHEKCIIQAHTGFTMNFDFSLFHKFCEELLGRHIYTHQLPSYEREIKEKSKDDFNNLCKGGKNANLITDRERCIVTAFTNCKMIDEDDPIYISYISSIVKKEIDYNFIRDNKNSIRRMAKDDFCSI